MADEYIIPIGIDGNPAIKSLGEIVSGLEKTSEASEDAGKKMNESLVKPVAAADKLEAELVNVGKKFNEVAADSTKAGKALGESLNIDGAAKGFTQNINDLKKRLNEVTEKKKIGLEVDPEAIKNLEATRDSLRDNFDQIRQTLESGSSALRNNIQSSQDNIKQLNADVASLADQFDKLAPSQAKLELGSELASARQALVEETAALADYQAQLKEVDAANKDLVNVLANANAAVDANKAKVIGLGSSFEDVYGDLQPLTTRLGELEDRMYELALAGQSNTDEFKQLQAEAIKYRQTIQQVDSAVDTFAKRSAIFDITVEAVTGLTGAFAAAQGAAALFGEENEEIEQALLKVNAAMSILQGVQAVAAVFNKDSAISAVLLRNGLIGQAQATTTLTAATEAQTAATGKATIATRVFSGALKAIGIGLIIGLIAFLVQNWDKLTAAVNKFLPAGKSVGDLFDTIKSYAMGVGTALIEYLVTPFNAIAAILQGDFAGFRAAIEKGFSFKANFQKGFNDQELANQKAHQLELEKASIEADARDLQRRKNRGEDVTKAEQDLQRRRLAITEAGSKEEKEAREELEDLEDAAYKARQDKAKEAAKKAAEEAKKAAKEKAEAEKKNNEAILSFNRAYEDSQLAIIKDGIDKRKKEIDLSYARRIEDLKKETDLSAAAIVERNKLIAQLEAERFAEQTKLVTEHNKEVAALQLAAERQRLELAKETRETSLALFDLETKEIRAEIEERYKDQEELRLQLISALEENVARERTRINAEFTQKELKEEEQRQINLIELSSKYGTENEKTERMKQIALLGVKLEFAEKNLDLLNKNGSDENKLLILQAQKNIADIKKEIRDTTKEGEAFSWFEFLGLGDLSDEDQKAIGKAFAAFKDSVGQITDFIVDQYDRQIEKKQEAIDQLDDEIKDIEKRLDKEKALQEKGLANNVEAVKKELELKEEEKNEELRQQEELLAKKQELQRAQLIVDSVVQASNLAVAATEIFKSLASIPFVGVPLAIAAVGAMIGAFAVSRVKAAQAIKAQSFGGGGWIDGKPHSQGGVKYYSEDGDNIELEGDEYVVKAAAMRKYGDIVEAINDDDIGGLGAYNAALRLMLNESGISLFSDSNESAAKDIKINNEFNVNVDGGGDREQLAEIGKNLAYLAKEKRESVQTWSDDNFDYKKQGSRLTKIRKKNATT